MKHLFYILPLLSLSLSVRSQLPANTTNVDLTYLRPKWMGSNLTNLIFQNGEKLKVAKDLNEWKTLNSTGKAPESAVYKHKTDSGFEYYYNYYAITDPRNIIPKGYRLPNKSDFTTDIDFSVSNSGKTLENSSALHVAPYRSIEWNGVDKKFYVAPYDENSLYLWTSEPSTTTDFWGTQNIRIVAGHVESRPSQSLRTSGYIVRCVEVNEEEIKNKLHEYKLLLPDSFNFLKKFIEAKISTNCKIRFEEKLVLHLEVSFDQNGLNTSRILDFSPSKRTSELIKLIDSIIKSEPVAPIYNRIPLKAKTEFTIEYVRNKPVKEKKQKSTPPKNQPKNRQISSSKEKRIAKGRKVNERENERYRRQQTKLRNRHVRQDKKNERQADYVVNRRTVIKNYIGVSLGTAHPILDFGSTKQFSGASHSGFAKTGFSASLDSYIRIRNGVGVKIKADVMSFNFDSWNYERINMSPTYTIQVKKSGFVTPHYYLIQNLMAGFSFNIGKYKLLFEASILGGITTGINPVFKYSGHNAGSSINANQNVFVGVGYQLAGAFRIRCTSTFAIKIGASYMQSRIPQYTNPVPDTYGRFNTGALNIISISPQISFVGMFFRPK